MLDWVLVGFPVAITALIFGAALSTDPHDVIMQKITAPQSLEQRGYPAETLVDLLESEVAEIVQQAASSHHEKGIEIGTSETAIDQFADVIKVVQPIRATQRLLGMVDYIVDVNILEHQDKTLLVHMRIRDANYLGTLELIRTNAGETPFEDTLHEIAGEIVGFAEPYIMAAYLYNTALAGPDPKEFAPARRFISAWLPRIRPADRPWAYNLLGLIAERSGEPEMAIAYFRQALRWQPDFALAHVNWGRLLADAGDNQGAVAQYRAAVTIDPELAIAHAHLAEALLAERDFGEALAQLDQASALAPELARTYEIQAGVYQDAGMPDLATDARRQARAARIRQPRQGYYDAL
jgi:tetratricopeptide (TPR) repeat protein